MSGHPVVAICIYMINNYASANGSCKQFQNGCVKNGFDNVPQQHWTSSVCLLQPCHMREIFRLPPLGSGPVLPLLTKFPFVQVFPYTDMPAVPQ